VKVALSGDGADEILAGYDTYLADTAHRIYAKLPAAVRSGVASAIAARIPVSRRKVSLSYGLRQFLLQGRYGDERAHYGWRLLFDESERRALIGGGSNHYRPFDTYEAHYGKVRHLDPLHRALYVDVSTWLVDDILVKVDRASMAMGLEVRVPFLDPELVEFSMRLPPSQKLRGTSRKVVLRRAMRKKLPKSVLRRRKRGFNAPVSDWLRFELREIVEEHLRRPSTLVDTSHPTVQALWSGHLRGSGDSGFKLWSLLLLLRWERVFGETLVRP
jgi:asparagine synthase (glutamine-hydrolysing)